MLDVETFHLLWRRPPTVNIVDNGHWSCSSDCSIKFKVLRRLLGLVALERFMNFEG